MAAQTIAEAVTVFVALHVSGFAPAAESLARVPFTVAVQPVVGCCAGWLRGRHLLTKPLAALVKWADCAACGAVWVGKPIAMAAGVDRHLAAFD